MTDKKSALVLFSGGQDSSIALIWALCRYDHVETIGFDYGQRHQVEMRAREVVRSELPKCAPTLARKLGGDAVIDLAALGRMSESALTRESEIVTGANALPTSFVPGRNLIFLTLSAAFAYQHDIGVIVAGMCEADFSGYPDCRRKTLDAQMQAIELGMERAISLETPLMHLSKAQSWFLAEELGGPAFVDMVLEHTHSCYLGVRGVRYDWGYGCGACPACALRAKGFASYVAAKSCQNIDR